MKALRGPAICLVTLLLAAPLLCAQDLSRYRTFVLGTSTATILKSTDQKLADAKVIHAHPGLIQELTWWPPNLPGTSFRSDSVEQILFSFFNGELYKISVTYDQTSTEGLTAEDMVKSISTKYGQPTSVALAIDIVKNDRYDVGQRPVASWDDSRYSFNLVRSSFTDQLGLIIYSKRANAEAELAIAEGVKLEEQQGPQREAERRKKDADDLEMAREKNRKVFHP